MRFIDIHKQYHSSSWPLLSTQQLVSNCTQVIDIFTLQHRQFLNLYLNFFSLLSFSSLLPLPRKPTRTSHATPYRNL